MGVNLDARKRAKALFLCRQIRGSGVCIVKKKKRNHKEKKPNRAKLIQLFKDYNELESFRNKLERFQKNSSKGIIILTFSPLILAIVIGIVGLMFCNKYIDLNKLQWLICIGTGLMIAIAIIKWKKLEQYFPEKIKIRDNEIIKLLKRNQIDEKNIKDIIDYFLLEVEFEKLLDNGTPVINAVSEFWHELFFVIFGVVISQFNQEEFKQQDSMIFATIMSGILVVGGLILAVKIWNYFDRKSSYLNRIQKLVLDLKQIDLLYYHKEGKECKKLELQAILQFSETTLKLSTTFLITSYLNLSCLDNPP